MLSKELLDILCCPKCKSDLFYLKQENQLVCKGCKLSYPIVDDIPVMLEDEARLRNDVKFE